MHALPAWAAIATALASASAIAYAALERRQGTDFALAGATLLVAAAVTALAGRLRRRPASARLGTGVLARLGHELRTPLHSIVSHVDALAARATADPERAALATIRRNTQHVLDVIVRTLALGDGATAPVPCRMAELVADVVGMLDDAAGAKGLRLVVSCPEPVPATIDTDPTALRQVLINLIDNAIKYTARGTVELALAAADVPIPVVRFTVRDDGPGIPQDELAAIFDPFVRGAAARGVPGHGIGLAVARDLARGLGGDVNVESHPGTGSTFTVTVPAGFSVSAERTIVGRDAGAIPPAVRVPLGGRILVVEDDDAVRSLVTQALRQAGAEVEAVGTGSEALGAALAASRVGRPFDVTFMDLQLPGLDGDEVVRRMRAAGCTTPVVALTAAADLESRERARAAGCSAFLAKPVGLDDLLAAARHHVGAHPLASTLPSLPGLEGVIAGFTGVLEQRVREIERAANSGDVLAVGRLAHRLRGAAGSHGFAPISDAALALEEVAVAGGDLTPALLQLARLCRRARAAHPSVEERAKAPVAVGFETLLRHEP